MGRPDRNDHAPAMLELVEERLRHLLGRAGHDDGIEGRRVYPTQVAVACADMDISERKSPEIRLGAFG